MSKVKREAELLMRPKLVDELYKYEDDVVRRFHMHPFFANFSKQTDEQLTRYLVQRWFVSQEFVPWYDRAINGVRDPQVREVLRRIMLDETPQHAPSHREDLLADLEAIGAPKSLVLTAKPTRETRKAIQRLYRLVDYTSDTNYDLRAAEALRVAGELLVAESYRHVVPELDRRFELAPEQSRFYAPHFEHDQKGAREDTHTDSFDPVLERMVYDKETLSVAIRAAEDALNAKLSFYEQFTARHRVRKAAQRAGAVAASLAAAIYAAAALQPTEQERYAEFIAGLHPAAKAFYLDADRQLLNRFEETHDPRYLKNIGTFKAAEDVWGPGP